jgi:protein-S-isoprenylcysteine O-methyltransferase
MGGHEYFAFALTPLWRQAFWVSYLAWIAIEIAIWSRDVARVKGKRNDRFSMFAIGVSIGVGNSLAFNAPRFLHAWIQAPPQLLAGVGIALIWIGIGLRLWAVRTLGRFFRVTVTVQDDHRLVDSGPYARLRNPSYTGAMITLTGIGIAMGHWLSLAAMILFPMLGFAWRIRVEEASLAARFGADYEAYRRRRWALVPPIW